MSARKTLPGRSSAMATTVVRSTTTVSSTNSDNQPAWRSGHAAKSPLNLIGARQNDAKVKENTESDQDPDPELDLDLELDGPSLPLAIPIPSHGPSHSTTANPVAPNGCPHLQLDTPSIKSKSIILENYRAIVKLCLFRMMNEERATDVQVGDPEKTTVANNSKKRLKLDQNNIPQDDPTTIIPPSIALRCNDCHSSKSTSTSFSSPLSTDWSMACLGLDCGLIGCRLHIKQHNNNINNNKDDPKNHDQDWHGFAVDLKSNELAAVFCCECNDFIVDLQLEIVRKTTIQRYLAQTAVPSPSSRARSKSKKHFSNFEKFNKLQHRQLTSQQKLILASPRFKHMVETKGDLPVYKSTTGLRGFYNMGATCFISVVLQSFIHNPFIRNHFLSDGHNPANCTVGDSCLACSIDRIFMDFYGTSGILGYGPSNFLISAWKTKRSLAGYSEQDAHEFLQFILNELHVTSYHKTRYQRDMKQQHEEDNDNEINDSNNDSSMAEESEDTDNDTHDQAENSDRHCQCITHRTFCGELQSNITCLSCGTVTKTIDPMLDLSLEIRKKRGSVSDPIPKKATLARSHDDDSSSTTSGPFHESLIGCLDRFTRAENLDVMYSCDTCQQQRHVSKQLSIKRLPNVLSIQLKRFQHTGTSSKIDTHVKFPLYVDMTKYTTSGNNSAVSSSSSSLPSSMPTSSRRMIYELFGVICHQGSINTGHYTCMIKNRDGNWYSFDDSTITTISQSQVLATKNAYLLFYIVQGII